MSETLPATSGGKLLDNDWLAWLVLALMLLVTLTLWQFSEQQIERRSQDNFLYEANKEGNAVLTRMQAYEQVLRGAAALFAASVDVSRAEWQAYVEPLALDESLPGILGTGFAAVIPPGEREAHVKRVRAEGFPDYQISPPGEREMVTSITYLEPFDVRNRRAFGYDMYSEPVRRAAMDRARDSGKAALSGKVTLLQEFGHDVQPGFLMYLPVYRNDSTHDDVSSRRAALLGFVYSPFRARDLMDGVLQSSRRELETELYDGEPHSENLLYASSESSRSARHILDVKLQIAGRLWTARVRSGGNFETSVTATQTLLILAAGVGLSFALFAMMLINARHRRQMRAATAEVVQSRDSYRNLVENIPGTVFRSKVEAPWDLEHISRGIEALLGESPDRFINGDITHRQFTHPDDMGMVVEAIGQAVTEHHPYNVEYRICTRDNETRWVFERGRASYSSNGDPQWLDGVIFDITDRKLAELAMRDLAFIDPLTQLPNRRLLTDRLAQKIGNTHRTKHYDAVVYIDLDDFKFVNDSLGHEAGDQLLVEIARRLLSTVRENDTVARLGGDEFVVILDDLADNEDQAADLARQISEKLISALNQPFQLGEQSLDCSSSIGVTIFSGREATVGELLRRADQAMYQAKSAGRNRLKFHEPTIAAPQTP